MGFETFLRSDQGRIFIFSQVGNDKELSRSEVGVEGGGGLTYSKRNNVKRCLNFSVPLMCFTRMNVSKFGATLQLVNDQQLLYTSIAGHWYRAQSSTGTFRYRGLGLLVPVPD
jgi:hypothetical protein